MKRGSRQPVDLSALSDLAPELAEMLASVAGDIVLVLDQGGVIRSVALGDSDAVSDSACAWVGLHWMDTVSGTTRGEAAAFLDHLAGGGVPRLGHVAHPVSGTDVPITYTAVRLGEQGLTLAVGRDQRAVSTMQERLLQTQRDLERDYWRHRQAETRYRLLFKLSTEAALVLDAASSEVLDANTAAARLLGRTVERMLGRPAASLFATDVFAPLATALDTARVTARSVEGEASPDGGQGQLLFSVTPFRSEANEVLLVMLRGDRTSVPGLATVPFDIRSDALFSELVRRTADAVVVCDLGGRIRTVNDAFLDLVQWPAGQRIDGSLLSRFLGGGYPDAGGDELVAAILADAQRDGSAGLCRASAMRGADKAVDVELSATLMGGDDHVGFIIRIAHHQDARTHGGGDLSERNVH